MNAGLAIRFLLIVAAAGYCGIRALDMAEARREVPAVRLEATGNAADEYRAVLDRLESEYRVSGKPDLSRIGTARVGDEERERAAAFVRAARPSIENLVAASETGGCDWEVDSSQGIMAPLPHLPRMRFAGRVLVADAGVRLSEKDGAGAARGLAAAFRVARDARADDDFLICALVEAGIVSQIHDEVSRALDRGLFAKADRATIRDAVDLFDPRDPHGMREAIAGEGRAMIDWLRRSYQPGQPLTQEMREVFAMSGAQDDANARKLRGVLERGESLEAYLVLLKGAYDAVLAAWDGPRASDALEEVDRRMHEGMYGPLAAVCVANVSRIRRNYDKSVAEMALLRKRLSH